MKTKTIEELVEDALSLCREQGFSETSVHSKHKVFKAVIRRHKENGCDTFDTSFYAHMLLIQNSPPAACTILLINIGLLLACPGADSMISAVRLEQALLRQEPP